MQLGRSDEGKRSRKLYVFLVCFVQLQTSEWSRSNIAIVCVVLVNVYLLILFFIHSVPCSCSLSPLLFPHSLRFYLIDMHRPERASKRKKERGNLKDLSKHALTTKPNIFVFFLFSQPNTSKFNGIRNANGNTQKIHTVGTRFSDVCLYFRWICFSNTFCNKSNSISSRSLAHTNIIFWTFTFILISIEAYFLRLKCIYWFYRDSSDETLIANHTHNDNSVEKAALLPVSSKMQTVLCHFIEF